MKKIETNLLLLFFIIGLCSCDASNMFVGGGIAPDISAPEIFITEPSNLAYESGTFVIAGTATDNIKVTKVLLTVSRDGSLLFARDKLPQAQITGNYWSYKFEGLESGEYVITATAYDKAGNSSENSSKSIVITVDTEPSTVTIQKPNMKPKATLEGLNYREYANIEYFQNETFSIRGSVDDEYPLKEITLQLLEGTALFYSLTIDSKSLQDKTLAKVVAGSLYNWTVTVDSLASSVENEKYVNKLSLLSATEKHYLELKVTITDKAGNITAENDLSKGFLCLYQEADRPWIEVSSLDNAGDFGAQLAANKLSSGAQITGSAYDDDLLDTLEFRIVNAADDKPVKELAVTKASFGDTSFTTWDLTAPTNRGDYRLYYRLKDDGGTTSYGDGADWSTAGWDEAYSVGFQIIDESAPVTEIAPFDDYPESAYVTEKTPLFKIEGTTRDSAGIAQILLAWDPDPKTNGDRLASLRKEKWDITESGYHDGVRYWRVDLTTFKNTPENNAFKMAWSCDIPVGDFVSADGKAVFNYKKMYYCAISNSGNYEVGTFTIPKDSNEPTVKIEKPVDDATLRNDEGKPFTIEGTCADGESGIASLIIEYKNKKNGNIIEYDVLENGKLDADGKWSITSDLLVELGGSYQQIVAKAADKFGNLNESRVSIIIDDDMPRVSSITIDEEKKDDESKKYYHAGETLYFTVTMNRPVEVTEDKSGLTLELNCSGKKDADGNPIPVPAVCNDVGANEDKTETFLKFAYTVKEGDSADPLDYVSSDSLKRKEGTNVVDTDGVEANLALPEPGKAGSLKSQGVHIDTEKPHVNTISTDAGAGKYNADKKITISVQLNEKVNGRAKIKLNNRKNGTDNFVFMDKIANNTDTLEFTYTVQNGDTAEPLDIVDFCAYSENETITDFAGNEMDFSSFPQGSKAGSLASWNIGIDTTAPTLKRIYVSNDDKSMNAWSYKDGTYYLNTGKTITFKAEFSEAVELGESLPYLELNAVNSENKKAQAEYKSGSGSSILSFEYTVANGDNSAGNLAVPAFKGEVADFAKNKANVSGITGNLQNENSSDISIVIDTKAPDAPTFEFTDKDGKSAITDFTKNANEYTGKDTGYIENITVTAKAANGDKTVAKLLVSEGGLTGKEWQEKSSFLTTTENAETKWTIKAQLVDYAGNTSEISSASFVVDRGVPQLNAITTPLAGGLYKAGTQISVTLTFSKKVKLSGDSTVTFNNGGTAVISASSDYSLSHKGTYDVGNCSDIDTSKLTVKSIRGGTFSDSAGNSVAVKENDKYGLAISGSVADDFATKTIQIDTKAPTVTDYSVESISDEKHYDTDAYYANAGDTVKIAVAFSEAVTLSGDSTLALNNGKSAKYSGADSKTNTLYYTYEVGSSGDDTNALAIAANEVPTNVQDAAGNALSKETSADSTLKLDGKNITVDTTAPKAPTVEIHKGGVAVSIPNDRTLSFVEQVTLEISGETGAQISYSLNSGAEYQTYSNGVELGVSGSEITRYIIAKQTDKAGNVSPVSPKITITVDLREMGISKISTTKADGTYKAGDTIPITLLFTKKVSFTGLNLTLNNGGKVTDKSSGTALSHTIDYTIAVSDKSTDKLKVTGLSGTFTEGDGDVSDKIDVSTKITASFAKLTDNFKDNTIKIDTTAPTVESYSVTKISDKEHCDGSAYYVNTGDTVEIAVAFSEAVALSGDSTLALNNKGIAEYSRADSDKKTLYYTYEVSSSDDDTNALAIAADAYPTSVQDAAGNALSKETSAVFTLKTSDGKKITVDTTAPIAPLLSITAGTYKSTETVTLTGGEAGAKFYYSYDGGAGEMPASGSTFSTPDEDGRYQITAYQEDKAGNKSAWATPIEITVDVAPPKIKSISTTAGNGTYKAGDALEITVEFSESVKGNLMVTLNSGASVTLDNLSGNTATGTYTVADGENTVDTLAVDSVSGTITDSAGNITKEFSSGYSNFAGKDIKIDTKAPTITGYKVTKHNANAETDATSGTLTQNVAVNSNIVLQFDEKVSKGSGTITIERLYKSYPAVMDGDEYNTHKDGIKNYYIQRCIGTVNNGAAPDTNAKYVLKYEIDHGAYASSDNLNGDQAKVYNYFEKLDYNVTKIDVNSGLVTVADTTVTIQTPSALKEGVLYKVTFGSGTFADEAGNACDEEKGTSVQFETGPTATPVIRINKLSGRKSASDTTQPFTTTVKISSEMVPENYTFGGKTYEKVVLSAGQTSNTQSNGAIPSDVTSYDKDKTGDRQVELTLSAGADKTPAIFKIQAKTTKSGLTPGDTSTELAYKTVIEINTNSSYKDYYVKGSDSSGGVSATTEFPISWYTSETTNKAQLSNGLWVSWHVLKDFQFKLWNGTIGDGSVWIGAGASSTGGNIQSGPGKHYEVK